MRRYWDERARLNAPWYVDTSLSYYDPDLDRFFETGRVIAGEALEGAPRDVGTAVALEIGCGLGRICVALSERFDRVVGVDISSEMLRRAREVASRPGVSYLLGDGASLAQVRDGVVDLVLTFTVFQHIPSIGVIERYVHEAGRVLRPGGLFVFQWNNTPGSVRWGLRRVLLSAAQRVGIRRERFGRHAPEFLGSRVSMARMRRALEGAGLELVRVRGEGSLYAWAWAVRR
jgi:SAM-dependent methyltransferase